MFLRQTSSDPHTWDRVETTGAILRGTVGNFKGLAPGSSKNNGWFWIGVGRGEVQRIVVTESTIDALSLAVLEKGQHQGRTIYLSTDGKGALPYDRTFDNASFEQKVVLLHRCLVALLDPTVEAPMLTNVLEAAAYLPFTYILAQVKEEIACEEFDADSEPDEFTYSYREMVWKPFSAYLLPTWQESDRLAEIEEAEDYEPIVYDVHSRDLSLWTQIIDDLVDRIFWDRDWQLTFTNPQILDGIDPAVGEPIDLTDDYITNRLPKVSPEQAREALTAIRKWGSQ